MMAVTTVKYRIPAWEYCNNQGTLRPHHGDGTVCRFCIKVTVPRHGVVYTCAIHNQPLLTDGEFIHKHAACLAGKSYVEDKPSVDPTVLARACLAEYRRVYKQLLTDGYPDSVAHTAAAESIQMEDLV